MAQQEAGVCSRRPFAWSHTFLLQPVCHTLLFAGMHKLSCIPFLLHRWRASRSAERAQLQACAPLRGYCFSEQHRLLLRLQVAGIPVPADYSNNICTGQSWMISAR